MWLARKVANKLPNHTTYVEVFGGGGWLLFNKPPSKVEVYNDIDGGLVNMLKVIRDEPDRMKEYLEKTPYSRQEFYDQMKNKPEGDFEQAVQRFILYEMSINASASSWSYGRGRSMARAYHSKIRNIHKLSERLKFVQIENIDFRDCIERYDTEVTLFYLDPPYEQQGTIGNVDTYYARLPAVRHTELGNLLKRIKGMFLLSYTDCNVVRERYKGFEFHTFEKAITVNVSDGGERTKQIEVVISNVPLVLDRPGGVRGLDEF